MTAIRAGDISGQYVFYLPEVIETIKKAKSEVGTGELRRHLLPILSMLSFRPLELRYATSENFSSYILGEERGALLYKEPGTGKTVLVEFLSGTRLKVFQHYHERLVQQTKSISAEELRLVLGAGFGKK